MPKHKFNRDAFLSDLDNLIDNALLLQPPQLSQNPLQAAFRASIQRNKLQGLKLPKIGV